MASIREATWRPFLTRKRTFPGCSGPFDFVSVANDIRCGIGVKWKQRGKHPDIGIPENVTLVKVTREALRRNRDVTTLWCCTLTKIKECLVNHPLRFRISINDDVRFPCHFPLCPMFAEQGFKRFQDGAFGREGRNG